MKKYCTYLIFGALLIPLSFRVFGFWPLGFFALVPFFLFLNASKHFSSKQIFWGSLIFGCAIGFFVNGQVLYSYPIVLIPGIFIYGACTGFLGVMYTKIAPKGIETIFVFAALWTLFEWLRQCIFQGFDYSMIAYAAYSLPTLLSFASIGGTYLVSFIIAVINGFIGFFLLTGNQKKTWIAFIFFFAVLTGFFFTNHLYLDSGDQTGKDVSFSTIQLLENVWPYARVSTSSSLIEPTEVSSLFLQAARNRTDYILYPFNIFPYIIVPAGTVVQNSYISSTFETTGAYFQTIIPTSTKMIIWTDALRPKETGDSVFDEAEWWQNGSLIGDYQKRNQHPFYDETSAYFRARGVFQKPYEYNASAEDKIVTIGGERFGNMSCSELNYAPLSAHDANMGANITLSLGYASVFEYPILGTLDVTLAQFRAVETHLPFIRADIRGPSAFIDKNGTVLMQTSSDYQGVFSSSLFIQASPKKTFYTFAGDVPTILFLVIFLAIRQQKNIVGMLRKLLTKHPF